MAPSRRGKIKQKMEILILCLWNVFMFLVISMENVFNSLLELLKSWRNVYVWNQMMQLFHSLLQSSVWDLSTG